MFTRLAITPSLVSSYILWSSINIVLQNAYCMHVGSAILKEPNIGQICGFLTIPQYTPRCMLVELSTKIFSAQSPSRRQTLFFLERQLELVWAYFQTSNFHISAVAKWLEYIAQGEDHYYRMWFWFILIKSRPQRAWTNHIDITALHNGWCAGGTGEQWIGDMSVQSGDRWEKTSVQTFSIFLKILTEGAVTTEACSLFQYFTTLTGMAYPLLCR